MIIGVRRPEVLHCPATGRAEPFVDRQSESEFIDLPRLSFNSNVCGAKKTEKQVTTKVLKKTYFAKDVSPRQGFPTKDDLGWWKNEKGKKILFGGGSFDCRSKCICYVWSVGAVLCCTATVDQGETDDPPAGERRCPRLPYRGSLIVIRVSMNLGKADCKS